MVKSADLITRAASIVVSCGTDTVILHFSRLTALFLRFHRVPSHFCLSFLRRPDCLRASIYSSASPHLPSFRAKRRHLPARSNPRPLPPADLPANPFHYTLFLDKHTKRPTT